MKRTKITLLAAIVAAFAVAACGGKKDDATPAATEEPAAEAPKAEEPAAEEPKAEEPAAAAEEAGADYVKVIANHSPPKDGDPVVVAVQGFEIANASFDPANLEGGSAELVLDLNTINSGSDKRDGHLKSPDFLDVAKLPKMTVKIGDIKKGDGGAYTAKAAILDKTMDIQFEVVETMADGVKVKGSHKFDRTELGIGAPAGDKVPVANEITVELMLTLKKA